MGPRIVGEGAQSGDAEILNAKILVTTVMSVPLKAMDCKECRWVVAAVGAFIEGVAGW